MESHHETSRNAFDIFKWILQTENWLYAPGAEEPWDSLAYM